MVPEYGGLQKFTQKPNPIDIKCKNSVYMVAVSVTVRAEMDHQVQEIARMDVDERHIPQRHMIPHAS